MGIRANRMSNEAAAEVSWTDGHWETADGLTLHLRDYPGRDDRPPILCLPALIRNARDFETLARRFAGEWRVLCLDFRGRGESDYAKDPATYNPLQYAADVEALVEQRGIARYVAVGTSLGGIVAMLLAARGAERMAGAVLNDIGPAIERAGLDRIRTYVGQGRSFPTWMHAARSLRELYGLAHPDYAIGDWLLMAKRMMAVVGNGRIAFDYDMRIAEAFNADEGAAADLWPVFAALAPRPLLVLRGALSDILSPATFARMGEVAENAELLTVPNVGHAPSLDEPAELDAVARLLERVA